MVLGEFEFDDLWNNSSSSSSGVSQTFTMLLLTGVIVLGTIIMINLIVAIIITDIDWLKKISKQQVLRNKVIHYRRKIYSKKNFEAHHVVQINALESLQRRLINKSHQVSSGWSDVRCPRVSLCVHSVCKCDNLRTTEELKHRLVEIVNQRSNVGLSSSSSSSLK